MVLRDDYRHPVSVPGREDITQRPDDSAVSGHTADQIDWLFKNTFLERSHHPSNTFTECVKHGRHRDTLLLQVNEVALGKDAAPGGYPGRTAFTLERQAGEVVQADAQTVRLLLQEPSRAGGAERV